jgi:hypothetical protein
VSLREAFTPQFFILFSKTGDNVFEGLCVVAGSASLIP